MGASNVKPQTANIVNPYPRPVAIEVTPNVMTRLKSVLEQEQELKQNRARKEEQLISTKAQPFQVHLKRDEKSNSSNGSSGDNHKNKKNNNNTNDDSNNSANKNDEKSPPSMAQQVELTVFSQTMKQLEGSWGQPTIWTDAMEAELGSLRMQLVQCYRDHSRETLHCDQIAKKYQNLVFGEQYKMILKSKNIPIARKPVETIK